MTSQTLASQFTHYSVLGNAVYLDGSEDDKPGNGMQSEDQELVISDEFAENEMECEPITEDALGQEALFEKISHVSIQEFLGYSEHLPPENR